MTNMWDLVGLQIRLKGKTSHGKNRIREHGDLWEVLGLPTGVTGISPRPPFPAIQGERHGDERWFDPKHFEVAEVFWVA